MPPPRPLRLWWVYLDREVHGPFKLEQILKIPGVSESTRVCPEDTREWRTLADLAAAAQPAESPLHGRRCPDPACGKKVHLNARFCDRCGKPLESPESSAAPAAPGGRAGAGTAFAWTAAALALVALSLWSVSRSRARPVARAAAGTLRIEALQLWHAAAIKDVFGDERRARPGHRWCVVRLAVRGAGPGPQGFRRGGLQALDGSGRSVAVDSTTAVFPDELRDASSLAPGEAVEGHLVFQLEGTADVDAFRYADGSGVPLSIAVSRALRLKEKSWRGREAAAIQRLQALRCAGKDPDLRGKTVAWLLKEWKDPLAAKARQEQGPVYHVDLLPAPDDEGLVFDERAVFSFHVDIDSGRIGSARDADTLATHNTRYECLGE